MFIYEAWHTLDPEYYTVETGNNLSYPPHIHYCYEIIAVTEGEMEITVDGHSFALRPGQLAVIFPNQLHSLNTPRHSAHRLCIFSPEIVGWYSKRTKNLVPERNLLETLPEQSYSLFCGLENEESIYSVKGVLYLLFGEIDRQIPMTDRKNSREQLSLIYKTLDYIQQNSFSECSLKSLAKSLQYDYAYLSKFFKKTVGYTYCEYLNMLRADHACYLLRTGDGTVLDISAQCGYSSLRTFNRNFRKYIGMTPQEYRKSLSLDSAARKQTPCVIAQVQQKRTIDKNPLM